MAISGVNNCKLADPVAVKYPVKPDETLMSRFRSETKGDRIVLITNVVEVGLSVLTENW